MAYEVKDGEVAIIVSPDLDEDGAWTGILKTGLIFGEGQHPLAMRNAMDYALTMAAASEVLEEYPELGEYFDDARHRILCLLYTSPSPRAGLLSRMPSSA